MDLSSFVTPVADFVGIPVDMMLFILYSLLIVMIAGMFYSMTGNMLVCLSFVLFSVIIGFGVGLFSWIWVVPVVLVMFALIYRSFFQVTDNRQKEDDDEDIDDVEYEDYDVFMEEKGKRESFTKLGGALRKKER